MTGIHGSLWEMRAMPLLVHSVSGLHQLYPLAHYFSRSVGRYGLRCYPFAELAEIELDT